MIGIEALINPRLQECYSAELMNVAGITDRRVSELRGVDAQPVQSFHRLKLNEYLMYHGVPHHLIDRIAAQNADVRYAGENFGKLFGAAIYLATNASKSDIYTTTADGEVGGERAIFVMRACLGECHETRAPMREATRPPERADGKGPLDSVRALTQGVGGCVEHPEFMVYKSTQVLPMYLIRYRHRDGCRCTHCDP